MPELRLGMIKMTLTWTSFDYHLTLLWPQDDLQWPQSTKKPLNWPCLTENELKAWKSLKDSNEEAKRKINVAKGVFKVNHFFKCSFPIGPLFRTFDQSDRGL